jgi:hypothetical protein
VEDFSEDGSHLETAFTHPELVATEDAYDQYLANMFQADVYNNGFDFERDGVTKGLHGQFKDKGDTTTMGGNNTANALVRMNELNQAREGLMLSDQSEFEKWINEGVDVGSGVQQAYHKPYDPNDPYGLSFEEDGS